MADNQQPIYTGMDKYPGIIATIITIVVGLIFIGALYQSASHHDDGHHEEHAEENH